MPGHTINQETKALKARVLSYPVKKVAEILAEK